MWVKKCNALLIVKIITLRWIALIAVSLMIIAFAGLTMPVWYVPRATSTKGGNAKVRLESGNVELPFRVNLKTDYRVLVRLKRSSLPKEISEGFSDSRISGEVVCDIDVELISAGSKVWGTRVYELRPAGRNRDDVLYHLTGFPIEAPGRFILRLSSHKIPQVFGSTNAFAEVAPNPVVLKDSIVLASIVRPLALILFTLGGCLLLYVALRSRTGLGKAI